MKPDNFNLDTVLFTLSDRNGVSPWTIRQAVEGVQIFGGIGSGKTSASGRMFAQKYLHAGFGGLVLTAKPDEKDLWVQYCMESSRLDDLIIIEPGGRHAFNFLEYESSNDKEAFTENIVDVLKTVIASSEEKTSGKSDDPFWESALNMLISNVIDLCLLAYGKASVQVMYDIVMSAPKREGQADAYSKPTAFAKAFEAAQNKVNERISTYLQGLNPSERAEIADNEAMEEMVLEHIAGGSALKFVDQFFIDSYRNLSEKTRSIIEFSFSGFLFRLLKEPVRSLFCNRASTFTPEDCRAGKIILLNLPVKRYHKVGRDTQVMFKYIWQRAMENKTLSANSRPVFLWADEAQHFIHEHDTEYQATARSSVIATVYLSQNLPNYHANMGGSKSEHRVKSFLGTLGTKVFHANADMETNNYASDLIGQAYTEDNSRTVTTGEKPTFAMGASYKLEKMVRPEEFIGLRTGGSFNEKIVECFIHRQGIPFQNGMNFLKIRLKQN